MSVIGDNATQARISPEGVKAYKPDIGEKRLST